MNYTRSKKMPFYRVNNQEFELIVYDNGLTGVLMRTYGKLTGYSEILPPDPYPIEERYINATDRPFRDGFKYE